MIVDSVLDLNHGRTFFRLADFRQPGDVFLKLEGFNLAGSIKLKPAVVMIEGLEKSGRIRPGVHKIVESSSGNLGIALSLVCKAKGYDFTCVVDPHATADSLARIRLYGGHIVRVTEKDGQGGYLNTRIRHIGKLMAADPSYVWPNQYANPDNIRAHERATANEILAEFPTVHVLFIGTSSTGTLGGCARRFKERSPETRIIAVEPAGSVTFGDKPARRLIPGLGASRPPELASRENVADVVRVTEPDTISMCREVMERHSLFIGPSTGTALCGVRRYAGKIRAADIVVAISPDFGDKYLESVYNPDWVKTHYGDLA